MRLVFRLGFTLLVLSNPCLGTEVILPGNDRVDYFTSMLTKALSYTPDKQYRVGFIDYEVPKLRAFKLIANNEGIDTIAAGATNERQSLLRSVKIPLLKGLNGWRVPLVTEKNRDIFLQHKQWPKFKSLMAGQLLTWSDTKIIESNGINILKGSSYTGLFTMLAKQRFEYFPRSVLEVEYEYEANKHLGIVIEPHILLHYPTAYYFYVHKNNLTLARDIEYGLERAIEDGSFDRIFHQYYGGVVDKIKRQDRRIYELHNPFLPKDVPLERKSLWLTMTKEGTSSP